MLAWVGLSIEAGFCQQRLNLSSTLICFPSKNFPFISEFSASTELSLCLLVHTSFFKWSWILAIMHPKKAHTKTLQSIELYLMNAKIQNNLEVFCFNFKFHICISTCVMHTHVCVCTCMYVYVCVHKRRQEAKLIMIFIPHVPLLDSHVYSSGPSIFLKPIKELGRPFTIPVKAGTSQCPLVYMHIHILIIIKRPLSMLAWVVFGAEHCTKL